MPTKVKRNKVTVKGKHPLPKTKAPGVVNHIGPFTSDQFSFLVASHKDGDMKYLNDFLYDFSWDDDNETVSVSGTFDVNNEVTGNGERITDHFDKGSVVQAYFTLDGITWDKLATYVVWGVDKKNDDSGPAAAVTFYDQLMHLKASYDTFLYYSGNEAKKTPWTAYEITKDICTKYGIPLGSIPNYKGMHKIDYIYAENTSIYDFLLQVWTLERQASKKRFLIRFPDGHLTVTVKVAQAQVWELVGNGDGAQALGSIISSEYSSSLDPGDATTGTATVVTVRGIKSKASGEDARIAAQVVTLENPTLVKEWGQLRKVFTYQGVTNKAKLTAQARTQLLVHNAPVQSGSIESLGIPYIKSGDAIWVADENVSIAGALYVSAVGHAIANDGSYTMTITLGWMDIVPDLLPDQSDLKATDTDTTGGDGSSTGNETGKPDAMPSWLFPIMKKACGEAGVPVAWASDPNLVSILTAESGFNPKAQNPTSTAYGLFQFLDTTWSGYKYPKTDDPYQQCVDGLQYISRRNGGTPKSNWAFHLAHGWY